MQQDDYIRESMNSLIKKIQLAIQQSDDIDRTLKDLEAKGVSLNLSLLIGIFLKNDDGVDMFFSSMGDEPNLPPEIMSRIMALENNETFIDISPDDDENDDEADTEFSSGATWTKKDIQYLRSIGIEMDSSSLS